MRLSLSLPQNYFQVTIITCIVTVIIIITITSIVFNYSIQLEKILSYKQVLPQSHVIFG